MKIQIDISYHRALGWMMTVQGYGVRFDHITAPTMEEIRFLTDRYLELFQKIGLELQNLYPLHIKTPPRYLLNAEETGNWTVITEWDVVADVPIEEIPSTLLQLFGDVDD
jgi:hypothetical protein